jgi:hypothetical protein
MKFKFRSIWNVIPVPMFITDATMADITGACARGPIIFVRPKYIENKDEGIIQHELTHVKQFYIPFILSIIIFFIIFGLLGRLEWWILPIGFGIHSLTYLLFEKYRLWSEVSCYKVQASYYPDQLPHLIRFADVISKYYRINITKGDALKLLMDS